MEGGFGASILIVEDDVGMLRTLDHQLSRLGCAVSAVNTASGFLTKIYEDVLAFDLLIVDLRLDGIDGDKLITWLRESESAHLQSVPVIIITGHPGEVPDQLLRDFNVLRVLPKPYTIDDLKATLQELLTPRTLH